jgi:hypothetical protein
MIFFYIKQQNSLIFFVFSIILCKFAVQKQENNKQ